MPAALHRITDTVYFVQTDLVNWTLAADADGVLLIDAGYPGSRDEVLDSVRELGFGPEGVRAILLTHAHVDHLGSAIWFAKNYGTPVYTHAAEVGHVKRQYLEQASPVDVLARAWQPRYLAWSLALVRKGGLTHEGIPSAEVLAEDVASTLPGTPTVIPTPGHTGGHCSYLVDGVLVAGDALITGHPVSSRRGPQLLPDPFNHDHDGCVRSLTALGLLDTEVLLPGHGPVWRGPIREAAELATR
ncbi:MAG: MBL fold metallo-hydrolase [Mycobacterium sp.]|nr:MBL fold metallo-hydrolase [Mycobacterium sp.]